jgi:DNA-binding transcriptional regulator YiaG
MAPERIDQLLAKVDAWAKTHGLNQVELAKELNKLAKDLNVKPSHVTEWKKGRSKPNGETALAMLELIKSKPKRKS